MSRRTRSFRPWPLGRPQLTVLVSALLLGVVVAVPAVLAGLKSPTTRVTGPADGSVVAPADLVDGHLVIEGTAGHANGVAIVELVIKQLDTGRYWNGDGWQPTFIRIPVEVEGADGASDRRSVSWAYHLDAAGLEAGRYRARAFARSVDGNGDANGGQLVEFDWRPNLDRSLYDTEITSPGEGATIVWPDAGAVTVTGRASSTDGVGRVRVVVRRTDTERYWNGASWSDHFTRIDAAVNRPGDQQVTWSVTLPADAEPGAYRVRAWAQTTTGLNDPFGRGVVNFDLMVAGSPTSEPGSAPSTTRVPPTTIQPQPTVPAPTQAPTSPPWSDPSTTGTTRTSTSQPASTRPTSTRPTSTSPPTTGLPTPTSTRPDPCPGGDPEILVPCEGVLIGSSGDFTNDDGSPRSKQDHVVARERQLGADFDIFHDFLQWADLVDRTWPKPATADLAADGHILFTNWKSPTGHPRDWAAIARGDHDDDIKAAAQQFVRFGQPTFLTFYHEPEDNIRSAGDSDPELVQRYIDDYRAAFRHLHDVFEAEGADNVVWVWDMQGWLRGYEDYYEGGLYPGDDVVDWVAWNPYNWYGCHNHGSSPKWRSFTEVVAEFYDWLDAGGPGRPGRDKPLMLGEFGTEENTGAANSSQTKAEWIEEATRVLPQRFPRLRAVVYFDTEGRRANGSVQFCRWGLDSSPSSLDAMRAMLGDDGLRVRW